MKKSIWLLLSFVMLALNACDTTDYELSEATPEFLLSASLVKKWEMIDPSVEITVGQKIPVIKPAPSEGQVDNGQGYFYFIFLDKTIRLQDGYGVTATDKSLEKGRWDFTDETKRAIRMSWSDREEVWNIKTLTPSILEIEMNGVTRTFAPTPGNP